LVESRIHEDAASLQGIAANFQASDEEKRSSLSGGICEQLPEQGHECSEKEPQPSTNLFYYFDQRDRKCKLFFYKGCGGNQNRFRRRNDCEHLCDQGSS